VIEPLPEHLNLYDAVELKTEEDALEYVAKKIGIVQPREVKIEKAREGWERKQEQKKKEREAYYKNLKENMVSSKILNTAMELECG